jgi:hypothetical protein
MLYLHKIIDADMKAKTEERIHQIDNEIGDERAAGFHNGIVVTSLGGEWCIE